LAPRKLRRVVSGQNRPRRRSVDRLRFDAGAKTGARINAALIVPIAHPQFSFS
jgi:hypothetical protein